MTDRTYAAKFLIAFFVMCTIAILAVLWQVSHRPAPELSSARRHSEMKQLALGAIMYSADWDDRLPSGTARTQYEAQIDPYIRSAGFWHNSEDGAIYYNFNVAGVLMSDIVKPTTAILFYPQHATRRKNMHIGCADGSTHEPPETTWLTSYDMKPPLLPPAVATLSDAPVLEAAISAVSRVPLKNLALDSVCITTYDLNWPLSGPRGAPPADLLDAFEARNRENISLSVLKTAIPCRLSSDKTYSKALMPGKSPEKLLFNKYPKLQGAVGVSLPGYSADGKRALVFVDFCSSSTRKRALVALHLSSGTWTASKLYAAPYK